jgi:predicted transcriptional regulator of viral defense system
VDFLSGKQTLLEKENAFREAFLARLSQKLAVPTAQSPTVRCWTESALNKIFRQVRDELATEDVKSDLSHSSLLEWLCRLHLAAGLPIEGESVYLLEIGASGESEISPLELLMAGKPLGIICYFSAVAYHGLTTQIVQHHHVAEAPREHSLKAQMRQSWEQLSREITAKSLGNSNTFLSTLPNAIRDL